LGALVLRKPSRPSLQGTLTNTNIYCYRPRSPLAPLLLGLILALILFQVLAISGSKYLHHAHSLKSPWQLLAGPSFYPLLRKSALLLAVLAFAGRSSIPGRGPVSPSLALKLRRFMKLEVFRARVSFLFDRGQTEAAISLLPHLTAKFSFASFLPPGRCPLHDPTLCPRFYFYMLKDSAILSAIWGTDLTSCVNFFVTRHGSQSFPLYCLAARFVIFILSLSYFLCLLERFENGRSAGQPCKTREKESGGKKWRICIQQRVLNQGSGWG